jgi:nucleotide sugar dehydrogenase
MDNSIVVGGLGVVGTATRKLFNIKDYLDLKGNTLDYREAAKKKYVFICLPTEPNINGYDIEPIYEAIKNINQYPHSEKIYILRSTVAPSTTDALMRRLNINNIVYVPEFLTMRTIDEDTFNPDILVVGSNDPDLRKEITNIFMEHFKNKPKVFTMETREAEMVKMMVNLFYVTKVVFANQIYDVCQDIGADYNHVIEAFQARKWTSTNHFQIWFDGHRGAGGKCLRKDLVGFNRAFSKSFFNRMESINESLLGLHEV